MTGAFFRKNWFIFVAVTFILLIGGLFAEYYFRFEEMCTPNAEKNKVVILIAKDGIYDTSRMNSQVIEYFKSVKKDLDIENAGLKKFGGKTFEELDKFVDNLYLNDNVGYIIFVGDDLPVIGEEIIEPPQDNTPGRLTYRDPAGRVRTEDIRPESLLLVYEGNHSYLDLYSVKKLECIKKDCDLMYAPCRDVAVSFVLPPLFYSDDEKLDFVLNVLATYTNYHENFDTIIKKYQKSLLWIYDTTMIPTKGGEVKEEDIDSFLDSTLRGYGLSIIKVHNIEVEKATAELKKKHIVLSYNVHGTETSVGISLLYRGNPVPSGEHYYTSLEEFSNFSKENGVPALFVTNNYQSYADDLKHTRDKNIKYCCWPQIYLESGVWALYRIGQSDRALRMQGAISDGNPIGLAIRKRETQQGFIFGDILAHMK